MLNYGVFSENNINRFSNTLIQHLAFIIQHFIGQLPDKPQFANKRAAVVKQLPFGILLTELLRRRCRQFPSIFPKFRPEDGAFWI